MKYNNCIQSNFFKSLTALACVFLFNYSCVFSQECDVSSTTINNLKTDIKFLASDSLEGREVGTKGEQLALEYLASRIKNIGLKARVHRFKFNTYVDVNFWSTEKNIYPTKYSSKGSLENVETINVKFGIHSPDLKYSDYNKLDVNGKVVLINTSSPDGIHPHSKYFNYHDLFIRAQTAREKGAIAVIFYTEDPNAEVPREKFKNLYSVGIPVLFSELQKENLPKKISFELNLKEQTLVGKNLIAEINNNQENTIVIGAHYDHVGWGDEGSLYVGERAIHNGADDNASGTAALLELARIYKTSEYKNNNYLFVAFSGEEKGLLGSNALIKSDLLNSKKINYMFNMDMIGRLDKQKKLAIYGTGTSPRWIDLLKENKCNGLNLVLEESGLGPSDHTSFYLSDIPVLSFFTGAHEDYHKPSDDAEKINYEGVGIVLEYIQRLINDLNDEEKLAFTKTSKKETEKPAKFSVTLGVIPDYLYSETGMRIDGVIDGRPAFIAGFKKGDVVIKLGHLNVTDMMSYMNALSTFNSGDEAQVTIIREEQEQVLKVIF